MKKCLVHKRDNNKYDYVVDKGLPYGTHFLPAWKNSVYYAAKWKLLMSKHFDSG